MILLVTGGSGSGKSAYAEKRLEEIFQRNSAEKRLQKYYLATMQVYGEEGKKKVERHRSMRQGKGFQTIEQPCDLSDCLAFIQPSSIVLLECMSNLTANEMFRDSTHFPMTSEWEETVAGKICAETKALSQAAENLVIVTNNVFEDGITYDESTMAYLRVLGKINRFLSGLSDEVIEVVVGIPVRLK